MISIYRIEQLHAEGKQARANDLPFSANPYPMHSEHAERWDWGYVAEMLAQAREKEVAA